MSVLTPLQYHQILFSSGSKRYRPFTVSEESVYVCTRYRMNMDQLNLDPGEVKPDCEDRLHVFMLGDAVTLQSDVDGTTVYNHDNPTNNALFVALFGGTHMVVSSVMPCCGGRGEVDTVRTEKADGGDMLEIIVRCTACSLSYELDHLSCRENRAMPKLTEYESWEEAGLIYVCHPDRRLSLKPSCLTPPATPPPQDPSEDEDEDPPEDPPVLMDVKECEAPDERMNE